MNPVTVIAGIVTIIDAIQNLEPVVADITDFISKMFSKGLISIEEQDQLNAYVNAKCEAILKGEIPPAWQVDGPTEEDPRATE